MITHIINEKSTKISYQINDLDGDVGNFLAELETIINGDWNDYGEAIEVEFAQLGMLLYLSREGNYFKIKKISGK